MTAAIFFREAILSLTGWPFCFLGEGSFHFGGVAPFSYSFGGHPRSEIVPFSAAVSVHGCGAFLSVGLSRY